jgi:TP901 family phage tail tape measure protein
MPSPFDLNATIKFQAKDLDKIQKEVDRFSAPRMDIGRGALAGANAEYLQMYKNVRRVRSGIEELGNVVGTAARRFGGISVATGTFLGLARGIKNSVGEAITFEREMIKVAQATDNAVNSTETLRKTIMNVGETYGASGVELAKYSRILAQAGFSAKQTQGAIKLLAKADLTGTFGGISENVEGMIAIMQQFGKEAAKSGKEIEFLEKAYDSISRVSKKYAVESGDIIDAVKKAGGVFATAGGSLEEFIAILTSVRATTRESADVIANGLKTIAVRLQDTDNVKALQKLGIQLEDTKGNFVGVFSAVQRLSEGLKGLDPKSIRFANIVKELGGVYQIGRFITLIQEAKLSQEALNDALTAGGDINRDVAKQQQSLGFQIDKLAQRFNNLVLEITKTSTFKEFTGIFMEIADALLNVGNTLKDNLPLFKTFFALLGGRAAQYAFQSWAGMSKPLSTKVPISNPVPSEGFSGTRAFQSGGHVTSRKGDQKSDRDSLKAILQPGEYVLRKKAVETIGVNTLNMMNQGLLKTVDIATQRKASFSNRTSPQKGYTGTVAQILQKTKLKSLESLYDIDNPADMFIAPAINRTPLRYADGSKVRYNDLKMQAGGITKQAAAEFSKSGPKAANNFLSSIDLGGYVDKVSNKTFSSSGDIFKLFTSVQGAIAEKIFQKANPSYQKLPNAFGMDMISTDGKFAEIKATSTRMSPHTMIGKALIALARFANPKSGYKNKQRDVIGIPETTFYDTALRFNTGGIVPGSGSGDKIPALLEPGEVVVNKRAAQNVGYDVFNAMNRGSISMLADGTPNQNPVRYNNKTQRYREYQDLSVDDLVKKSQSGIEAESNKAVLELMTRIARAAGNIGEVGDAFKKLFPEIKITKTVLSQFGRLGEGKLGFKQSPKGDKGMSEYVLQDINTRESNISRTQIESKNAPAVGAIDVAQTSASVQTTQAVQENTKVLEEIAKNTAETIKTPIDKTPEKKIEEPKTASANAKTSKEAQVSSATPKKLQDIINLVTGSRLGGQIKSDANIRENAKRIIQGQGKSAGFSEEEIAKAIQNTPDFQDGAASQAPMRKINLKDSGLLERETKAINKSINSKTERYKAEQSEAQADAELQKKIKAQAEAEAEGKTIAPEKISSVKSPLPKEHEEIRQEIMAEATAMVESLGKLERNDPRFEGIYDKAKANVLARREQEAKAQSEAKAREEAASTVEVPVGPSSGGSGVPPTPPSSSGKTTPEDGGKRRKKKSVGAEETVPPVAEAAAKVESEQKRIPVIPSIMLGGYRPSPSQKLIPATPSIDLAKQKSQAELAQRMGAMGTSSGGAIQKLTNDPFAEKYGINVSGPITKKPVSQKIAEYESPKVIKPPKSPRINKALLDLLVANGVATPDPLISPVAPVKNRQKLNKASSQASGVTSPKMLKELQKSKTESENRQASGKIISGLLDQYGVKPQQNFDPSWIENQAQASNVFSPKRNLGKEIRSEMANKMLSQGSSQQDINKWFGSEEGKKAVSEEINKRKGDYKAEKSSTKVSGSYAQSSIDPKQAAAMKEKAQAEIEYKNKSFFGKVASKFPATKYLKYTGLGFGRGGSGNGAGGGVGGASGGPNDPNNSAKNLANGLDEAADKASGFGSAMGPLPLVIGMLVTNSELFTGALKSITGASDQQVKSIQDSIAAMTAFYFTFQQLNSIMKSSVPKIDAQGNILGDDGKAVEIEGPDGKATKVQAKGIKGKIARGARFAASKGLTFGNLALAGAAAAGTSNFLASQKTQEAQKKQGLISKDLEKVSVGGNISLEELQKRSREAYGLQDKANRGRSMGFFSGLATGTGGAYAGAAAGAALGSVVPVLGTAVGGVVGGAAGAILGGAVGAGAGSAASDYMYKQPTLDEKSIDASVKAQYVAAKSSYNFGKTIDKLRSGTLKTEDANKLASQGAIDAAKSLDQTRAAAMTANVALKDAEDQTSTFAGWLWTSTKDIDAFRERVSKSEEALAQSREVAKQARSTQADQFNANLAERLSKASTSSEIDNLIKSISGEGRDQTFTNMLDALESATAAASDEPDRAKAQIAASEDRAARQAAAQRSVDARQFEIDKIETAIAVRTAEITLMQQFNNAMKSVTSQTLSMQDAQSKVSVLRGESGGGFNTDRLRDISQVGDIGAFKNTANSLASLVPGGAALAQKATTAGSASDQFRNLTTTSGLFTGLNELRKVIKPGVDASKTRTDISSEISKNIPEFSSLDTVIQDQVINKLYENLSEGNLELSQIADIGKVISDSGQKFADVLIAAGENANNFVEQLRGVNAALIEEQNKLIQLRSGSIDIRSRGMERMASVSTLMPSQKTQLEANREAFRQAKDAQMLGDVGLRSGSAGQLGQSLTGINAQIQANKQQLSDPNLDVKKRANLNLANQGLESQANALTTVLGRLTDQSDRASDKMEQISRIQVQKELVKNRVESFAFGTTEQKFAMAEQAAGLQQVMRTGNFNVLPDDLKGQVSDFMKQLAEANPEGAVGQMFRKIQVDAIKQQQAMGFLNKQDAQAAIDVIQGNDIAAEKKLKQELADINKQELIAQQALIDAQRDVTKSYLEMVNVIKQGFVNPAAGGQQQPQAGADADAGRIRQRQGFEAAAQGAD